MAGKDTPARQDAVKSAMYDRLFNKPPVEHTVHFLLDPQLADEADAAVAALRDAEVEERVYRESTDRAEHAKRVAALEAAKTRNARAQKAAREASVELQFRAIGRLAFDDLVNAHPPIAGDPAGAAWHAKTFEPALVAATLLEPKLSVAEVTELLATWNVGEGRELVNTALVVNTSRKVVDPGKD